MSEQRTQSRSDAAQLKWKNIVLLEIMVVGANFAFYSQVCWLLFVEAVML